MCACFATSAGGGNLRCSCWSDCIPAAPLPLMPPIGPDPPMRSAMAELRCEVSRYFSTLSWGARSTSLGEGFPAIIPLPQTLDSGVRTVKSTDLRPGMAIKLNNKLFVITQFQHVTPGNLRAKVQLKIKSVENGQVLEERLRAGEEVEQVDLDKRQMEYLYSEPSGHVFMDSENYDQVSVSDQMI